jgi:hypothetical protein
VKAVVFFFRGLRGFAGIVSDVLQVAVPSGNAATVLLARDFRGLLAGFAGLGRKLRLFFQLCRMRFSHCAGVRGTY